jgi:hypothetical protein
MSNMGEIVRRRAPRNRIEATHKFPVGAHVVCEIGVRAEKAPCEITRLLPDGGAGLQYRIKDVRDGVERVVTESAVESATR